MPRRHRPAARRDRGALRRALAGAALRRGRRGFRPQVDCIRTERPARADDRRRAAGRRPGRDPRRSSADRVLVVAGERRRPQVRRPLPADRDRVRALPAPASRSPGDVDTARRDRRLRARPATDRRCRSSRSRPQAERRSPIAVRGRAGDATDVSTSRSSSRARRARDPRDAAGAAAEGDGRLPAVDGAARDRPGALDQAGRRRRRRRADARARHARERRGRARRAGTTSTRSAPPPSSTR